ncbi:hypothetical protein [Caloranaerobacter sp. DY30410]|uniref:hypothetical protein n=1 Tax=Caloranaerobacter sp. DY30410 TaxID=3238305 RepID=UPI003D01AFD0
MLNLKEEVTLAINCLIEGLDDKKTVVDRIVDYVDKNYIAKEEFDRAFDKLRNNLKGDA